MAKRKRLVFQCAWSAMAVLAVAPPVRAECCRVVYDYQIQGSASTSGTLVFTKHLASAGCGGGLLEAITVSYDNVPGGALPTTAEEIEEATDKRIAANGKKIQDCGPGGSVIDFCVNGVEITGNEGLGSYGENGITITGTLIDTVKVECPLRIDSALLVMLATAGAVLFRKTLLD